MSLSFLALQLWKVLLASIPIGSREETANWFVFGLQHNHQGAICSTTRLLSVLIRQMCCLGLVTSGFQHGQDVCQSISAEACRQTTCARLLYALHATHSRAVSIHTDCQGLDGSMPSVLSFLTGDCCCSVISDSCKARVRCKYAEQTHSR